MSIKRYRFFIVSELSVDQMSAKIASNSLNNRKVKRRVQLQRNNSNVNRSCRRKYHLQKNGMFLDTNKC